MVYKGLSIHKATFHSQSRTGDTCKTKIPVQELWQNGRGAYTQEGAGRIHGTLQ